MNLRKLRYLILLYIAFDFLIGYAGIVPLTELAAAQFTTVTGTVTDPNGLPYANGTISALLITSASPTLGGLPYTPPTQPTGLDKNGSFTMQLADNTQLSPAATKWNFTVCSALGTVQPVGGKGPVCFTLAAPITISGSSQSISVNLNAIAPALTNVTSGVQSFVGAQPQITVGANGGIAGQICIAGSTSGCVTVTAPAVAGTTTNPLSVSNVLTVPASDDAHVSLGNSGNQGTGLNVGANFLTLDVNSIERLFLNSTAISVNLPLVDFAVGNSGLTFANGLISLTGTAHPNFGFASTKGQHLVSQAAQADSWGVATCAANTVTVTFTTAYTSTPAIVVSDETAAGGARVSAKSNSAFTITCSGATDVVDYFTGGNPN
jgi:hypothetical protein